MPAKIDYNALGQALDTTWGRSSTPLTSSTSVKMQLAGEGTIKVNYASIVSFRNQRELQQTRARYVDEARCIINATINDVKKTYKELTGKSIKTSEVTADDSLEVIGLAVHNPIKRAYARRTAIFEIA